MTFNHVKVDLGYDDLKAITKPEGRRYVLPNGGKYPSITTVLSLLSEKGIAEWKERVGEEEAKKVGYRAATRGTAVHEIIEKYVNNDPDFKTGFMPNVLESFLAIKPILDERLGDVYAQEAALYSDHLGVAGRVDCVGQFDNKPSIIDYKTSAKFKKKHYIHSYFMQKAAYAIMWEERTGQPITQLVTLIAVDPGKSQVFIEHRDNWVKPLQDCIQQYNQRNSL